MTTAERIDAEIDALAEGAFAFLERLVAEPSVVGEEAGAQAVVEAELARLGFAVELLEVPESIASDPLAGVPQGSYAGRPVVVGRLSGGEGPTLLVNGHVDVVPAGWPGLWSSPPFAPVRRDGWLHGRGAGDMKCGFAMALLAVEALLRAAPEALAGSLVFVSAIEEECTGNGTLASIRAGVVGDAVLLPEPTGLDLLLGGAGVLWCELTVSGRAGHAHEAEAGRTPSSRAWRSLTGCGRSRTSSIAAAPRERRATSSTSARSRAATGPPAPPSAPGSACAWDSLRSGLRTRPRAPCARRCSVRRRPLRGRRA